MSASESWQASTLLTGQPFLVASRHEAKTKHGAAFLNVQLKAKGGREITGRLWDRHRALFERSSRGAGWTSQENSMSIRDASR